MKKEQLIALRDRRPRLKLDSPASRCLDQMSARRIGDHIGIVRRAAIGDDSLLDDAIDHRGHERRQGRNEGTLGIERWDYD